MTDKHAGVVHIANEVLSDLAGYAALESYGVVGMASPTLADGVAQLLPRQKLRKGVRVVTDDRAVSVDLYVVVEHGVNIAEVSNNLISAVRHMLTNTADVDVARIDVHVMGVKVRQAK